MTPAARWGIAALTAAYLVAWVGVQLGGPTVLNVTRSVLQAGLVAFYGIHALAALTRTREPLRVALLVALLLLPIVAIPAYWFVYLRP